MGSRAAISHERTSHIAAQKRRTPKRKRQKCVSEPTATFWSAQVRWRFRILYWRPESLYRYALGEIARFVDVAAECDSEMIRQKLEWNDGENRHHVIRRFRHHDDLVRDSF